VRTSIGEKTFWQDFDGQIRETRYEYGKGYSGGDVGSIIAEAKDTKYQGPLAAFSTKDPANAVTLFYISTASTLRSTTFSSLTSTWTPTSPLSALNIPACPASSLAVTCYGGKSGGANIRLYYQDPSLKLRELASGDGGNNWRHLAEFELPALVGTSMACDKWMNDDETLREIQFVYQDSTCEVRSHFYLAADDTWYWGYLHLPSRPPQCGLAVSAHRHLGYGGDVCRVFVVDHGGKIVEHAYYDAEETWKVTELAPQLLTE
ncbi:MAG: hypothetical protein L6R42_011293, partial [Xanthoria sp. 1 TBL-2021]